MNTEPFFEKRTLKSLHNGHHGNRVLWSLYKPPISNIQILQTDLRYIPQRIHQENLFKSKNFLLGDHFVNSHNLFS